MLQAVLKNAVLQTCKFRLFSIFPPFPLEISEPTCVYFHMCKARVVGFGRPWSSSHWRVVFVTVQRLSCRASPERLAAHGAVRQSETNTMALTLPFIAAMRNLFQHLKQKLPLKWIPLWGILAWNTWLLGYFVKFLQIFWIFSYVCRRTELSRTKPLLQPVSTWNVMFKRGNVCLRGV